MLKMEGEIILKVLPDGNFSAQENFSQYEIL